MKALSILLFILTSMQVYSDINNKILIKLHQMGQFAYSTIPTIINTYELSEKLIDENINGVFIECGVAGGAQVGAMALACKNKRNYKRYIYLFDSFEGIPLAGPNDHNQPGVGTIQHDTNVDLNSLLISSNKMYPLLGSESCSSVEAVKTNLLNWGFNLNRMIFIKGWFQNTLPNTAPTIDKIALLRLDGDLYESTKVCLEYLYPKVSSGGYVIIDDFALPGCKKAVLEYFETYSIKPTFIEIEGGLGPVFFRKE